ncbi:anillin-like [Tachypleus tridentatus]|uniref:anillin-like n=1 Tax=Tachypleus tridentatus TaxID=6853 RepID=UPI003FD4C1F1
MKHSEDTIHVGCISAIVLGELHKIDSILIGVIKQPYPLFPQEEDMMTEPISPFFAKEPIGSLDLRHCVTPHVGLVSRDICARPHTFQLVIARPHEKGDRDTLITCIHKTVTSTKHLLSADTKEERIMWCTQLNEALSSIRRWDPQALRPTEFCHMR